MKKSKRNSLEDVLDFVKLACDTAKCAEDERKTLRRIGTRLAHVGQWRGNICDAWVEHFGHKRFHEMVDNEFKFL